MATAFLYSLLFIITAFLAIFLTSLSLIYGFSLDAEKTGYIVSYIMTPIVIFIIAPLGFVLGILFQRRKKRKSESQNE